MTDDKDTQKGYRPVQATDENYNRHEGGEEGAWQDRDLLPEERCCCGALQRLASPIVFCGFIVLESVILGAAFTGTGGGVLSTIEKRFQLKTSELAPFLIVNDIVNVVMVLFVAYYGHTSHRPRIIGGGTILVGLGFLLCTLPHFLYDAPSQFSLEQPRNDNMTDDLSGDGTTLIYPVCRMSGASTGGADNEVCTEKDEKTSGSLMWQVSWIIVGQILAGIGAAPLSPLCVTYIDDCVEKASTAVFISVLFVAGWLGTLLGYGISSASLSLHAEFYKAPTKVHAGDPNWLGAWWLCYAIPGVAVIIAGVPLTMFPKKMRKKVDGVRGEEGMEMTSKDGEGKKEDNMESVNDVLHGTRVFAYVKGFLGAIRRLVTNAAFVSLVLGSCAMVCAMVALFAFMAKYIETQFDLLASATPMLTGIMTTPGMLVGNIVGGFVVKKLQLTEKGMARMVAILKPLTVVIIPIFFFLGCDNRNIAGITSSYPTTNRSSELLPYLTTECNSDCACPTLYTPICGSDGVTYASPCHAGCLETSQGMTGTHGDSNTTIFTDCSCIGAPKLTNQTGLSGDHDKSATPGECHRECNTLIAFVAMAMVSSLVGSIIGIPSFMLTFRTVDEDDRSIAIGFSSMMVRLLATIPAPVIIGAVIQTACLLLQTSCGKTGNCLVYDIVHFRYVFFGLSVVFEVLSMILYIVCYFTMKEKGDPKSADPTTEENTPHSRDSSDVKTGDIILDAQLETDV